MAPTDPDPLRPHARPGGSGRTLRRASAVVAALALLALLAVWLLQQPRADLRTDGVKSRSATTAAQSSLDAPAAVQPESRVPEEATTKPPALDVAEPGVDRMHARITGRFVHADRSPAAGVDVHLSAHADKQRRPVRVGWPEEWSDRKTSSDNEGRFSFTFVPSASMAVQLDASSASMCPITWDWDLVEPGETKDLGDIEAQEGGVIVGHVLDAHGKPLSGQSWSVSIDRPWYGLRSGRRPFEPETPADATTGEFRMEKVPPGTCRLRGKLADAAWFEGSKLDVRSGETVQADLICPIDSMSTRISVMAIWPPCGRLHPQHVGVITLTGQGKSMTATPPGTNGYAFTFDGLDAGSYSLAMNDPRYAPWSLDGVQPGSVVEARLMGSAAVVLSVVDARTGTAITDYAAHVVCSEDEQWFQGSVAMVAEGEHPASGVRIDGLLPVEQTLVVSSPGRANWSVVLYLAPGETHVSAARMSAGAGLEGRVLAGDERVPVGDVDVMLAPKPRQSRRGEPVLAKLHGVMITRSAAPSGRFSFGHVPPGEYLLQASMPPGIFGPTRELDLTDSDSREDVDVDVPASFWLHGKVLAPASAMLDRVHLLFVSKGRPDIVDGVPNDMDDELRMEVPIHPDGSYAAGPLAAGDTRAFLVMPETTMPHGLSGAEYMRGPRIDLGELRLVPGKSNERDFDVRASFPGTLLVSITLNGKPAIGCTATLFDPHDGHYDRRCAAVIEREGPAALGPTVAGAYTLLVWAVDRSWYWVAPGQIRIVNGEERTFHGDIVTTEGIVRMHSEGVKDPVISSRVMVTAETGQTKTSIDLETDASGLVHLTLPPGRYSITAWGLSDSHFIRDWPKAWFDWPLTGPQPRELTLVEPER